MNHDRPATPSVLRTGHRRLRDVLQRLGLHGQLHARRAQWYAWEGPLASEPAGVYKHDDGRPMLGRKLKGKSQRELRDLGLLVEDGDSQVIIRAEKGAPAHG